ncbi:ferritin-like domain-containing protein [Fomitopsis betulina]|nr:ferritin-like domain-containing protein [Fomitopsis betulina]
MFTRIFTALIGAAMLVRCAPAPPAPSQTNILQFALTLEYLESAFYVDALAKYDAQAFLDAGFPDWVRGRFVQISAHEATHVETLKAALGANAPQPCQYSFPITDPHSFVELAFALEGVGAAAYLGAAQYIDDKATLTVAGSILAIEERQASWISSSVLKQQPWNGAFETYLSPTGVYSLASQFITSCPSTNPALPVTPLPMLSVANASPALGSSLQLTFDASGGTYAVWLSGLEAIFTPLDGNKQTTVPDVHGTVYVGVVSSQQMPLTDSGMVTGLAIVQMPFDSMATIESNA